MRRRLAAYRDRVLQELRKMVAERHTPHEVAASFAVGIFITALPTLGVGILGFFCILALVDRASKIAMFASIVVLNPVAKWGVYGVSFWLGTVLLGPVDGVSFSGMSSSVGPAVLRRLLLGNFILALLFTVIGYGFSFWIVSEYRRRDVELVELLPDTVVE